MKDKQFNFWQKWLTYANVMIIGVGVLVGVFSSERREGDTRR